ncbi:MAG: hypothetical protein H6765_01380 [Candidatus Peribacteria bacterium]|nr:MAG: hypothetical protein H6765_01380 [Candidatus Peribacteria bacterium]
MQLHEFELRYKAYQGLKTRYQLNISEEDIFSLVKKTDQGALEKVIYECSLDELWDATRATYTQYKKDTLASTSSQIIEEDRPLATYIERLEYELKVIHEM